MRVEIDKEVANVHKRRKTLEVVGDIDEVIRVFATVPIQQIDDHLTTVIIGDVPETNRGGTAC
jgi:hypothetical protein